MKYLSALLLLLSIHSLFGQSDSLRAYYQSGIEAYENGDYKAFLTWMEKADQLRPNHPSITYNMASGYALTKSPSKAVETLEKYLSMNASNDYLKDTDFESLKNYAPYNALEDFINTKTEVIMNSQVVTTTDQKTSHFESISSWNDKFFLGSVNTRAIFRLDNNQLSKLTDFSMEPEMFSVMGLDFDKTGMLWVCTTSLPQMTGYHDSLKNQSSIFQVDPGSGKTLQKFSVPDATLGDLIIASNGNILATDGLGNRVYTIRNNEIAVFANLDETFFNLQGIAEGPDAFFVSDYITGLFRLDKKTGQKLTRIDLPKEVSEKGIDGLIYDQGWLYCFQNGTTPKRVIGIEFKNNRVTQFRIIDQNLYEQGEPTQGVIKDNRVYYIANSAWHAWNDGEYQSELADDLEIRSVPLMTK